MKPEGRTQNKGIFSREDHKAAQDSTQNPIQVFNKEKCL
jgi:hypothetical protein